MKTNFSLRFFLKKPKNYLQGPVPIYLRLTVDNKREDFTSGRSCDPEQWNQASGRMRGSRQEVKTLNLLLDSLQQQLYEIHRKLTDSDEPITAKSMRNALTGKVAVRRTLVGVFSDHNMKLEALVGTEWAPGTAERYRTSLKHTIEFMQWKYGITDIDLRKIDHEFIIEYDFYLRSVRKCGNNTTVKYLKNFNKIIRIALASGWIEKSPFANYRAKVKKVERVFLTTAELSTMQKKVLATKRLSQVRDIFLFCCYTGLAYVDVYGLGEPDIIDGIDGKKWISIKRQKTNVPSQIPLLPQALAIIETYENSVERKITGKILPVLSNQKMNSYLKEIADFCGIKKELTFHIARHTFATTVTLLNGVPIETVSKMLGHTNIQTTQHYAKILDIKVGSDMEMLSKKLA
ncbi:MAG: site-specific integrase [Pedobacter sp.]|nr:MAG: site-specific integrase [Pedobacter sp.]